MLVLLERCQDTQSIPVCCILGCKAAEQSGCPGWALSPTESTSNEHESIGTGPRSNGLTGHVIPYVHVGALCKDKCIISSSFFLSFFLYFRRTTQVRSILQWPGTQKVTPAVRLHLQVYSRNSWSCSNITRPQLKALIYTDSHQNCNGTPYCFLSSAAFLFQSQIWGVHC